MRPVQEEHPNALRGFQREARFLSNVYKYLVTIQWRTCRGLAGEAKKPYNGDR